MRGGLRGKGFDHRCELGHQLARSRPAVKAQVKRDLIVARAAGMQRSSRGRDLCQPPLHSCVNVLIRVEELELACVELSLHASKSTLDGAQLCGGDDAR